MTFKKILALSIIASAAGLAKPAVGQSIKLHSVANHIYVQHNGEWYTFANGERADRVDLDHLIVRVQESASIHQVNFAQAGLPALKDIRGRFGNGFYELEVPRRRFILS